MKYFGGPLRRQLTSQTSDGDHIEHGPRGLLALLLGLVALMALGALALPYMVDVGADVLLAVIAAVTPP